MKESKFKRIFFSIYSYTIIYALFGVLSLSYHACFNSSLSTLEKRYHFSSSTGGLIMITDNIATVLTNLFIGYYGKTAHKPRWMAIGCVVTGLSVMLTAVPYFIYGPAQEADLEIAGNLTLIAKSRKSEQMCHASVQKEDCSQVAAATTMTFVAVGLFAASNFFRGFGTSIYFTYGTPYLDDNISKAKMPAFFGFVFAARILGAPIGFYFSSLALKYYENPFSVPINMTPTDPRWIGAWWIGFLVSGTLLIILAIPLAFFPREFKRPLKSSQAAKDLELSKSTDLANGGEVRPDGPLVEADSDSEKRRPVKDADLSLKKLPGEIFEIVSNPIVLCQMMGNLFRGIGITGYFVFQAKYLEAQFRQSASKASLVSGTTGFMAKISGVVFGGVLITLFRPGPRALTTFIFLVEVTSVFTLLYGSSVIGPQYEYPKTSFGDNHQLELKNQCNSDCYCELVRYQPVCEQNAMKAYFSPCHAGCKSSFKVADGTNLYNNCNCIDDPSKSLIKCPPDMDRLIKYATIVALGGMVSGSSRSGNMVTFFRSITKEQKSMAVAIGSFWHSLFVSIPYPIIYGKIFDYSCLVWSYECGKRGNCWLYDTEKLRFVYHTISITLIALGSVFDLIMIYLSPRLGNLYDKPDNRTFKQKLMFWKKTPSDDSAKESTKPLAPNTIALAAVSSVAQNQEAIKED